jgi:hypothetical protein
MPVQEIQVLSHQKLRRKANACKKEVLLSLLTAQHSAQRSPYLAKVFRKGETSARARFQKANLVGIGFGAKETNGAFTGELAVRVYVTRKLPRADLPGKFRVPDLVNGIVTDVIPVGPMKFQSRPATIGASISHIHGLAGSIGCVLAKPDDNAWYLLSAAHVFLSAGNVATGDQIVEPAAPNGTVPIATLTDFEPLRYGGRANSFDAGIARIVRKSDVKLTIPQIGSLRADVMEPVVFQSVRKFGAATGHTLGIVTDIAAEVHFTAEGEDYLFVNVVAINGFGGVFSKGGDSGALVVDGISSRPVGLVIGGAEGDPRTYVSPLARILTRFGAQIAQ